MFERALQRINSDQPKEVSLQGMGLGDYEVGKLCEASGFTNIESLDLRDNRITSAGLKTLAQSGAKIRTLNLGYMKIGWSLGALDGMESLEALFLGFSGVDERGLRALASAELPALRWLDLMGLGRGLSTRAYRREAEDNGGKITRPPISAETLRPLLGGPLSAQLEMLVLTHAHLDASACAALGGNAWPRLHSYVLNETDAEDAGALIAGSFPSLRLLERVGAFPKEALENAPFIPHLETLRLSRSDWDPAAGDVGAALVERAQSLTELDLNYASGGSALAAALSQSRAPLRVLRLVKNDFDDDAVKALLGASFVDTITLIGLSGNVFAEAGMGAVASAPFQEGVTVGLGRLGHTDAEFEPLWTGDWLAGAKRIVLNKNRLSDASLPALLKLDLQGKLDLTDNAFTTRGFAKLTERFGSRVLGAERQNPQLLDTPNPRLKSGALRFVEAEGPAEKSRWAKVPARVESLEIPVRACGGDAGWFVGHRDEGIVLVKKSGKVVEPNPAIPSAANVEAIVHSAATAAWVMVQGGNIVHVDLKSGSSTIVGSCPNKPCGGVVAEDQVVLLHGSVASETRLELFRAEAGKVGEGLAHIGELPGAHQYVALHPSKKIALIGVSGFSKGPLTMVAIGAGQLALVKQEEGGCTILGTATNPLIKLDGTLLTLDGVDEAVRAALQS